MEIILRVSFSSSSPVLSSESVSPGNPIWLEFVLIRFNGGSPSDPSDSDPPEFVVSFWVGEVPEIVVSVAVGGVGGSWGFLTLGVFRCSLLPPLSSLVPLSDEEALGKICRLILILKGNLIFPSKITFLHYSPIMLLSRLTGSPIVAYFIAQKCDVLS